MFVLFVIGCANPKTPSVQAAYSGWCKYYNRHDITIDEWCAMVNHCVLPGMQTSGENSSSAGMANGVMLGTAMGIAASSRK
jgi:hypothetical protein